MDFKLIRTPSEGTKKILKNRMKIDEKEKFKKNDAIGLVQGKLIDIIWASDIAEKSAGVIVEEVRGMCPQHMTLIAILGDISSVETAINSIKSKEEKTK